MVTEEKITEHYKKYGVIEGDKLLLETAKNNYQKGYDEAKDEQKAVDEYIYILHEKALRQVSSDYEQKKAELIEKIKDKLREYFDKEYYNDFPSEAFDILDTFKSPQHEEIPAMGRTEDSLGNGKTKHNSPEDISPKIPQEYLIVGSPVVSNSSGCGKEFIGFNDKGEKIKAFCWDKDKLGDWRCPECQARDKK
jgi:hypothetical protein